MTRAWLSFAVLAACAVPQQSAPTTAYSTEGTRAGGDGDLASAICQHLNRCGLADDVASCTAEFATYDPDRTRSLLDRDCAELAELKAGNVPGGGGGGGACAVNGTNDCGMGMMCCAGGGGAASPGVPGSCVSVAICTGPRR